MNNITMYRALCGGYWILVRDQWHRVPTHDIWYRNVMTRTTLDGELIREAENNTKLALPLRVLAGIILASIITAACS